MISEWSKRGRKKIKAAQLNLWTDFYIWDNWLKSNHFTLDTLPMRGQHFHVERLQNDDTLYMCVFAQSQICQRLVANHIKSLFRKADRPEPVFVTIKPFRKMQREILPGVIG